MERPGLKAYTSDILTNTNLEASFTPITHQLIAKGDQLLFPASESPSIPFPLFSFSYKQSANPNYRFAPLA